MSELYVCKEYKTPYEEGYRVITTLEEHDSKVRAETIDKLEQKLRIWDNKANAIPEYVWHCINMMKE